MPSKELGRKPGLLQPSDNMTTDHTIGSVLFIDGVTRSVFLDVDGRQHVLDNYGDRVYGVWIYIDEPEIVTRDTVQSGHYLA